MAAGPLDRRVRFERESGGRDSMGGATSEGWSPLASVWANRADASDGERYAAEQQAAVRMTRFRVRSSILLRSVTAKDRIVHDRKAYEILGVKETGDGRNRFLEFSTVVRDDWPCDG